MTSPPNSPLGSQRTTGRPRRCRPGSPRRSSRRSCGESQPEVASKAFWFGCNFYAEVVKARQDTGVQVPGCCHNTDQGSCSPGPLASRTDELPPREDHQAVPPHQDRSQGVAISTGVSASARCAEPDGTTHWEPGKSCYPRGNCRFRSHRTFLRSGRIGPATWSRRCRALQQLFGGLYEEPLIGARGQATADDHKIPKPPCKHIDHDRQLAFTAKERASSALAQLPTVPGQNRG